MSKTKSSVFTFYVLVMLLIWFARELAGEDINNLINLPLVYWMWLIVYIFIIKFYKWKSDSTFLVSLVLLITSALFSVFSISESAEIISRISFVGWMVGIGQTLVEMRRKNV